MKQQRSTIILSITVLLLIIVASLAFGKTISQIRSTATFSTTPTITSNSTASLPADPYAPITPGTISILASKYGPDATFIQEVQNQLGAFGIDETLPDPSNPRRVYYTYTTDGDATQIKYYDPASDSTYSSLHWPIVQNGSVSLTNGLTNIPADQTAHPVDVIGKNFIYAVSSFADRPDINDPCESLVLHYLYTSMFLIDDSGKVTPFTPSASLIASETQKQRQCSARH